MKVTSIDSDAAFAQLTRSFKDRGIKAVALDIEGESNLHAYGEHLCLLQVFDGEAGYLIDPFKVPLGPIATFLQDRRILKLMFDGAGDRAFLYKNCDIDLLSILDLQAAVHVLDYPRKGLSGVLEDALGVTTGKDKKKYQTYNWMRRPIAPDALQYALDDVIYLFELRDKLLAEVVEHNLLEAFIHRNLLAQNKPHQYDGVPSLLKSKRFKGLGPGQQTLLKALHEVREGYAKSANMPPHQVLANELLFKVVATNCGLDKVSFGKRLSSDHCRCLTVDLQKALDALGRRRP